MTELAGPDADDRIRRIESLTDAALAHLGIDDLIVELLERLRDLMGVDTAAALVVDPSGQYLVPVAAVGVEEVRRGVRIPVGKGFAGRIVIERRPQTLDRIDASTVLNPALWESGIQSLLGVPIVGSGSVTGVLHVGTLRPHRFTEEETNLLQMVADRAALAIQSQVTKSERSAAATLQRSLLPAELPQIEGVELAGRYLAGVGDVGGDWYDVFELPSGALALVIGDVVGRGMRAAVVMGRLRSALRAYALEFEDPAEVLTKLDRKTQHFEPDIMATVVYALIDSSRQGMQLSCAGHPPPLLATPGEPTQVLDVIGDLPIGVRAERKRRTITVGLPLDGLLCLYTDGLVEARDLPLEVGIDNLLEAAVPGPAEIICSDIMTKLLGERTIHDDVALLVLHRDRDSLYVTRAHCR